jgi:hypothetical protein
MLALSSSRILRPTVVLLLAGASLTAAASAGCENGDTMAAAGGAGGAVPSCTLYDDAGVDVPWPITADEVTLCKGLADRDTWCAPGCPTAPLDQCSAGWACERLSLRPEMVADLYACLPTVPCSEGDPLGACAAQLAGKYPPSLGQEKFLAAAAACNAVPSSCKDIGCGAYTDDVYESMAQCYDLEQYTCPSSDPTLCHLGACLSATLCNLLGPSLSVLVKCVEYVAPDAGAMEGG